MAEDELRKIIELFCKDGLNLSGVAAAMNIPQRQAREAIHEAGNWLLSIERKYANMVDSEVDSVLSAKVKEKYGLLEVIVPTRVPYEDPELLQATIYLCRYAARHLSKLINEAESADSKDHELRILAAGGTESFYVMAELPEQKRFRVHFYPAAIVGRGLQRQSIHIGAEINATYGWIRSGQLQNHLHYVTITPQDPPDPRPVSEDKIRFLKRNCQSMCKYALDVYAASKATQDTLEEMRTCNVIIGGFGLKTTEFKHNKLTGTGLLNYHGIDLNLIPDCAGDFAYTLFDHQGNGRPEWEFFLTPGFKSGSVRFLRKAVTDKCSVIGIGGFDRLPAIKAALKGRIFNVLVTDRRSALELLK